MRIAALDDDALQLDLIKQATEAMGHVCHTHLNEYLHANADGYVHTHLNEHPHANAHVYVYPHPVANLYANLTSWAGHPDH